MSWVRKSVGPRESDTNTARRCHAEILLPMSDIAELTERIRAFSEERDWTRFHDPKSLALALVGEVGELAELLQWLPADEAAALLAECADLFGEGSEVRHGSSIAARAWHAY